MNGSAFEFTPGGVRPLALDGAAPTAVIPAGQAIAALKQQVADQEAARATSANRHDGPRAVAEAALATNLTGRSLVAQIRARLRIVRGELKRLAKLEREEAELKRLLAAAKQPPAKVTDIHQARRSG